MTHHAKHSPTNTFGRLNQKARKIVEDIFKQNDEVTFSQAMQDCLAADNAGDYEAQLATLQYYMLERLMNGQYEASQFPAMLSILTAHLEGGDPSVLSEAKQIAIMAHNVNQEVGSVWEARLIVADDEGTVQSALFVSPSCIEDIERLTTELYTKIDHLGLSEGTIQAFTRIQFLSYVHAFKLERLRNCADKMTSPYRVMSFFPPVMHVNLLAMQITGEHDSMYAFLRERITMLQDDESNMSLHGIEAMDVDNEAIGWQHPVMRLVFSHLAFLSEALFPPTEKTLKTILARLGFKLSVGEDGWITLSESPEAQLFDIEYLMLKPDAIEMTLVANDSRVSMKPDTDYGAVFVNLIHLSLVEQLLDVEFSPETMYFYSLGDKFASTALLGYGLQGFPSNPDKILKLIEYGKTNLISLYELLPIGLEPESCAYYDPDARIPGWERQDMPLSNWLIKSLDPATLTTSQSEAIVALESYIQDLDEIYWKNRTGAYWYEILDYPSLSARQLADLVTTSLAQTPLSYFVGKRLIRIENEGVGTWQLMYGGAEEDTDEIDDTYNVDLDSEDPELVGPSIGRLAKPTSDIPLLNQVFVHNEKWFVVKVLPPGDLAALTIGNRSGCCQALDGTAQVAVIQSYTHPDVGVLVVETFDGKLLAQSLIWIQPTEHVPITLQGPAMAGWTEEVIEHAYQFNHLPLPMALINPHTHKVPDLLVFDSVESRYETLPFEVSLGYQLAIKAFRDHRLISVFSFEDNRAMTIIKEAGLTPIQCALPRLPRREVLGYSDYQTGVITLP